MESSYDLVYIYDGPNTSSPLIGTYDSSNPPTTVFGTTASGALTVRLTSDGVVQFCGFEAAIGCMTMVPPQARPELPDYQPRQRRGQQQRGLLLPYRCYP